MYSLGQVVGGITNYLDAEVLSKIAGWQKWVIGAGLGVTLNKSANIFNELKNNPMIKALGVIDKNDMIDVDTLYHEIKKQAKKGPVTFNLPLVGNMTLNESDVDKMYNNIREFE